MITNFKAAVKTWVFVKNGDSLPVARTIDFVIDPNNGKLAAIWIVTTEGLKLLTIKDVLRWNTKKILIADNNELLKADDFPKLSTILNREAVIIGAKVFATKTKKFLGVVQNFSFDTISPRILSIIVQKGFWPFNSNRIIPRNKIVKISKKGIFVKNEIEGKEKASFGNKKIAKVEE